MRIMLPVLTSTSCLQACTYQLQGEEGKSMTLQLPRLLC